MATKITDLQHPKVAAEGNNQAPLPWEPHANKTRREM